MFWGLIMEPQRRYTQQVKKAFHISMAALDLSTSSDEPAQVMCGFEGRNYLLCTLKKPDMLQCPLDLNFDVGSEVSFAANGKCHVHLTGYLTEELFDIPEEEVEDEQEEEEQNEVLIKNKKRSKKDVANGPPNKKLKGSKVSSSQDQNENSDSDDSDLGNGIKKLLEKSLDDSDDDSDAVIDEEDAEVEEEESSEEDEEELEDEEDSSLSEDESDEDEKETTTKPKMNGVPKKQEQVSQKQKDKKKKEKVLEQNKKSPKNEQKKEVKTPNKENQASKRKSLSRGVIIEDLKEGQGAPAKNGRFVNVYYEGKLKQSGKLFDSTTKGPGFSFRLGAGEVIKGWDIGVAGMKPGGKRRITCPPSMAYGQKGSPPAIPPNSTLVFEVELKKCH